MGRSIQRSAAVVQRSIQRSVNNFFLAKKFQFLQNYNFSKKILKLKKKICKFISNFQLVFSVCRHNFELNALTIFDEIEVYLDEIGD